MKGSERVAIPTIITRLRDRLSSSQNLNVGCDDGVAPLGSLRHESSKQLGHFIHLSFYGRHAIIILMSRDDGSVIPQRRVRECRGTWTFPHGGIDRSTYQLNVFVFPFCRHPLKAVKPLIRDEALIPIERIGMSTRGGGVNRRLTIFITFSTD